MMRDTIALIKEILEYVNKMKKWWLIPLILLLIIVGLFIILSTTTPVSFFLYPLI
jgi:uncharacterized integral membrane protein